MFAPIALAVPCLGKLMYAGFVFLATSLVVSLSLLPLKDVNLYGFSKEDGGYFGLSHGVYSNWDSIKIKNNQSYQVAPGFFQGKYFLDLIQQDLKIHCSSAIETKMTCLSIENVQWKVSNESYSSHYAQCINRNCQIDSSFDTKIILPDLPFNLNSILNNSNIILQTGPVTKSLTFQLSEFDKNVIWFQPLLIQLSGSYMYFYNTLNQTNTNLNQQDVIIDAALLFKNQLVGFYNKEKQ